MNKKEVIDKIEKLREDIKFHNNLYYNNDSPIITDYEYDMMLLELKKLEAMYLDYQSDNSPTNIIGGNAKREAGVLVKHNIPMLSLEDVFSKEEVYNFINKIKIENEKTEFVVERKIDGLSVALRYIDGEFVQGITRGDGIEYGEDVTSNLLVIKDLVKNLKIPIPYLEVRGEVYMKNKDFENVNYKMELEGKKIFANPRNCAAGTLRQLDSKVVKERKLSLFIFNVQEVKGIEFSTHIQSFEWLKMQGFKVVEGYKLCNNKEEVWEHVVNIGENREKYDYEIDGAVIKVNSLSDRISLGATSKVPKWAVAYKYPAQEMETVITDIRLTVGRSGRITPTAIFKPIRLCGTNVEKATLHNQDRIDKLDIRIGDTIVVRKAGEIIPEVLSVNLDKRPRDTKPYTIARQCPACGSPTIKEENSADTMCTGLNCPAQLSRHIINFVSRSAMDIKGFGIAYIESLIKEGYIKDIADIYYLQDHREELVDKGIIGKEKNTDKLLNIINESKKNDIDKLITGFGIRNIGKQAAKSLKRTYNNIDQLMNASFDDLIMIEDIGEISAKEILAFFDNDENKKTIDKLKAAGVNFVAHKNDNTNRVFQNMTFVITGTLENLKRDDAVRMIEEAGGKASNSVSKNTNYLLAGEKAGSKLKKAQELGITIITEEEFLNIINNK